MKKFTDLLPQERYLLLGKIVDAMIYDGEAVARVQELVKQFEAEGKIKSTFFPEEYKIDPQEN